MIDFTADCMPCHYTDELEEEEESDGSAPE